MKIKIITSVIFLYIITVQLLELFIESELQSILIFKFTLFEIGVIASIFLTIILIIFNPVKDNFHNRLFITAVIGLFLYQLIIVAPVLFAQGVSFKEIAYAVFRKSYFLVIPFFYYFLFPNFKKNSTPILIINLSGTVLLLLYIYNYFNGIIDHTSTGEVRIASGASTILFAFMLITNFSLFSQHKNNFFFLIISLLGLIFANHKSAYLGVFILTLFSLINLNRIKNKFRIALQVSILLILIIVPLTQIPFIADNFWGRVTSSFTTDDPNADSRFEQYEMAWEFFIQHPLNGSMINTKFYFDESMNNIPPHSFIFQLLATQGITGFVIHTFLISLIIYISYKNRRDSYSFQMFLLILFYLVFTLLNENFYSSRNIMIFNFAAALILYRNKCIENAKGYILSFTSINSISGKNRVGKLKTIS